MCWNDLELLLNLTQVSRSPKAHTLFQIHKPPAAGWSVWLEILLTGLMLTLVNLKLVWAMRYVTRGTGPHFHC